MGTITGKKERHCIQCKTRFYVYPEDIKRSFCCTDHFNIWFKKRNEEHNKVVIEKKFTKFINKIDGQIT